MAHLKIPNTSLEACKYILILRDFLSLIDDLIFLSLQPLLEHRLHGLVASFGPTRLGLPEAK